MVRLCQHYGLLDKLSVLLEPLFSHIGLPGETAIVFITSLFCPLYAPIALIATLSIGAREATILALMCLVSHNLVVESTVQSRTGSSFWGMTALRVSLSFLIAYCLNQVMPLTGWEQMGATEGTERYESLSELFSLWLIGSARIVLTIWMVITSLMILHYILEEFKLMKRISRLLAPLMKVFGLPENAAFLWLVGNVVGLTYGGAIMVEQMRNKQLSYSEGNLLNYHLAVSHSMLEDTLIFVAIGIPLLWILATRLVFALAVVWVRRGFSYLYLKRLSASGGG